MKYVNDQPIDFTNEDWKRQASGERAGTDTARETDNRGKTEKRKSLPRLLFEWFFIVAVAILFAYVFVYVFGQQRTNVGQSMDPTLSGGDVCLINVLSYQVGSPKRGDIISFKPNGSAKAGSDIKRVIALPGETVQIQDGLIYIDGQVYLEGSDYPAITSPGLAGNPISLGEGEYFVLGDNRNNSEDSRSTEIGLVTSDMIEGKVWFVISPAEHRGFI